MGGPLAGIRVLDFSRYLSGPYCSTLLADWGADVIKVEAPNEGDPTRNMPGHRAGGQSSYFATYNRGKRSICIDLASTGGQDVVRRLTASSDVVMHNFTPATARRLKIEYTDLVAYRPDLVYCSITGFGKDGASVPAFDLIIQALSGVMSLTGDDRSNVRMGIPMGDLSGSMFAVISILLGLQQRAMTGRGAEFDISMLQTLTALLGHHATAYMLSGVVPKAHGTGHPTNVPIGAFATLDGKSVVIDCPGTPFFVRLAGALGHPEWCDDERFASGTERSKNRDVLNAAIQDIVGRKTSEAVLAVMREAGVPAAPVRRLDEALADPYVAPIIWDVPVGENQTMRTLGNPLSSGDLHVPLPPPSLGQHTNEVLGELGLDAAEIASLRATGDVT